MDKNIQYLKSLIDEIGEGKLLISDIEDKRDYIEHYNIECDVIDQRLFTGAGQIILHYNMVIKKTYKSQREIYKELYDKKYTELITTHKFGSGKVFITNTETDEEVFFGTTDDCRTLSHDEDVLSRATVKANQYAVENTIMVWKEQW